MELFEQLVAGKPEVGLDWKPEFLGATATIIGPDGNPISGSLQSIDSYDALSVKHGGAIGEFQFATTKRAGKYRTVAFRSGPEGKPEGSIAVGYAVGPSGDLWILGVNETRHLCCVNNQPQELFTPAGGWTDLNDSDGRETAERELEEELGVTGVSMFYVDKGIPNRAIGVSDDGMNMTEIWAYKLPWGAFYYENGFMRPLLVDTKETPSNTKAKLRKTLGKAVLVPYERAIDSFDFIAVAAVAKTMRAFNNGQLG